MKNRIYLFVCLTLIGFSHICFAKQETAAQQPHYRFVFENPDILSFDIVMSAEAYEKMQPERRNQTGAERLSSRGMFGLKFNYVEATFFQWTWRP